MKARLLLAATASLTLAACNGGDQDKAANAESTATSRNEAADLTPEEAGIFDKLLGGGQPMKLSAEQQHPNGGVLKINSVQVKPTETVVNMTYVNGHTREVQLNWTANNKRTYLLADNRKFFLSPPVTDERVKIQSGATVTGDLVFIGAVPQTNRLQLVVNEDGGTSDWSYNPKYVLDLPVTSAAWSDDGSKKKSAA
ncbi:hypothetical protein COC42_06200 [Sphingomonas spermidinifaciens]|uniref:DUF4352 domain-containing protein n=1 Tax=Sphingomonas spermidinifaciens TaxID=1141889 RepID=A0A2A4B771_9SPHN|nr:hypothetical protein [Sphingomonas spermidinifaciens]PCD03917.1 hypothetical protein COC42_06200 [Sphingomonas spermidinifaciens]